LEKPVTHIDCLFARPACLAQQARLQRSQRSSRTTIEEEIRGLSADERRRARDKRSRPIVDDLYRFLEARGRQVKAKSRLGEAIRYTLTRWDGLIHFLDDGRIDLDNNAVERAIRPLTLNLKNALFAGSEEGGDNWAVIACAATTTMAG
jgi:transposase